MSIMQSAINEIGRQVREQIAAREWCLRHPYPATLEQILEQERKRKNAIASYCRERGQS